jgi:ABC-type lipoprotein release transport system permease subunit
MTFAAVCIALMALAVAGCWLPAARASRVDPMLALRGD